MTGINSLINLLVVLVGVSVLVAWVGVANTVALALRERRTETTRLRALGLTRSQFHRTVVIETLLIAVFGSALGVVTGWSMAAGFITSMGEEGLRPVVDPVSKYGTALQFVYDTTTGVVGRAYDARTTPHMFIIDKAGRVAYMGGIDDQPSSDPESLKVVTGYVEPSAGVARGGDSLQFERHGYFTPDRAAADGGITFNRVTGLKDSWGK